MTLVQENTKLRGLLQKAYELIEEQNLHIDAEMLPAGRSLVEGITAALTQQAEPTDTFAAVDMATAAAQGFRDGQAATVKDCLTVQPMAYAVFAANGNVACFSTRRDHPSLVALEKEGHSVVSLAPIAQTAAQSEFGDAYQGAREDLAIWKRRALEAEQKVRHQEQVVDHLIQEAQGETRMGEPVIPQTAERDQLRAEVEALREDAERITFIEAHWFYSPQGAGWSFGYNEDWEMPGASLRDAIDAAKAAKEAPDEPC